MKRDKLRIYILELFLIVLVFLALFLPNILNKKILAVVLLILALIINQLIKKKKPLSYNRKHALFLLVVFSFFYLIVFYALGLYFGFYESSTLFSFKTLINFILPFSTIIISSELIRKRLLVYEWKTSKIFVFIFLVLVDLLLYIDAYNILELDDFLTLTGFVLFASMANNLLYNYLTVRFDSIGVITYRLITTLYMFIIPYIPNIYIFFRSFLRILYPYIVYVVFEYTYTKVNYATSYMSRRKNTIGNFILLVICVLLVSFVSCKFKYGIMVVGSGSMTGTINKGDAVVFEQYSNNILKKDDVIIFDYNDTPTIHRIISIENVNGQYRYFTKGDANVLNDNEFRTKDDIIGIVHFKIKYIGYPSLWLRDLFN